MNIIARDLFGISIGQQKHNGYFNATKLSQSYHAATGKRRDVTEWLSNKRTKESIAHLSVVTGIPVTGLTVVIQGGNPDEQGTWLHPKLAVRFGIWLSDEIGYWVEEKAEEWTRSRQQQPSQASMVGYWAERQRLFIQRTTIPAGWFCIFQEMAQLMWQLENLGYIIPDYSPKTNRRIVPDIAIGRMFCDHMRKLKHHVNADTQRYAHWYPGWTDPVLARIYPDDWLKEFRSWFNSQWKPSELVRYLGDRDPQSLPSICKLLGLPEPPVQLELFQMKEGLFLVPSDEIN